MKDLRFRAAGALGMGLVGGLFTTTRASRENAEAFQRFRREGRNVVFVAWHGHLLPLVYYHRAEGVVVLVSEHADGEYISRILEGHGFGTARGSSTRGGSRGLRELIRAAGEGRDLAITPDGPRGPARVFKPGALVAAQLSGLPVIPVAVAASAAWHFESWDRFMVPRPLARLRIAYGDPVDVPRRSTAADLDALAAELGERMEAMTARAEAFLADEP